MERKVLPYLVALSALSVSLSAAFYSVTGLSKMFAGAATQVMIMAGSLEIAKLVIASLLYQYWDKLGTLLKTYLVIATTILMFITSGGIYGYLSGAYAETSSKLEVISKNVAVYDLKRERFQTQLDDVTIEKKSLTESILELTKGLSNNTIQYKDEEGNIITTTSSSTRRVLTKQLEDAKQQRDKLSLREEALTDSVTKIDLLKLELETNTDIASEIGPLKYIASLTGKTIDQVVNWFIIALMLVFDPLAIALVISANVVFTKPDEEEIKEDFDEEDALDQVLNNMVEEIEDEIPPITEDDYIEPIKEDTDILMLDGNWMVNNPDISIEKEIKEEFVAPNPIHDIINDPDINFKDLVNKLNTVDDLMGYISSFGNRFNQYKTDNGYKIPLNMVKDKLKMDRNDIKRIQENTGRFEGRLIIDNEDLWVVK
ncbi:hypothetical protein OAA15_00635 [bacterium]|nr:hypothetical protein [bacterium]